MAVQVGDTVRLRASAQDSAGRPVSDVNVRWFQSGGHFEGKVDSTGLVTGGSTGTLTVSALVSPRSGGSSGHRVCPGDRAPSAGREARLDQEVAKLYAGQSLVVGATPYAANNDRRYDQVLWNSDAPAVVTVSPSGRLTAGRPGRATDDGPSGEGQPVVHRRPSYPIRSGLTQIEPQTASVRTGRRGRLAVPGP